MLKNNVIYASKEFLFKSYLQSIQCDYDVSLNWNFQTFNCKKKKIKIYEPIQVEKIIFTIIITINKLIKVVDKNIRRPNYSQLELAIKENLLKNCLCIYILYSKT